MDVMITLRKALDLYPDTVGVIDGETRLTYRELGARVARLARALSARGVGPGSAVAIVAPNGHEFLEAYFAAAALAAVLVPINVRLSPREIAYVLGHSEAVALVASASFAEPVAAALAAGGHGVRQVLRIGGAAGGALADAAEYEAALAAEPDALPPPPRIGAETLAHLYYTSGTTGSPKGVMLTHGNVTFHALAAIAELRLSDADVWLHAAPLFHLADAWATFAITWVGGTHVCLPAFDAGRALDAMERHRVTISNLIPTMLNLMVNHADLAARDLSSLRVILSGGAPIAPETVRRIVDGFGCDYVQTYGMTETSPYLTVSVLKAHLAKLPRAQQLAWKSRTGRPFLGVELRVVRDDGRDVARDGHEVGEILARGPTVTPGYWKDPEATAEAFSSTSTSTDRWLRTGDLAVIDSEGYLAIVDRKKDMILTGGENVYSTEVEHVLYEHPGVLEAAVIGVPHDVWGEAVLAVVVPRPGASPAPTEQDVIDFVKARIARYKAPKAVVFTDALPRTGSGKIAKRELRDAYRRRPPAAG
jgi:acyl-CoA synthetase (AMP-forming)/AMP-acid ligase II